MSSSKWILPEAYEAQCALLWLSPFSAYTKKFTPFCPITTLRSIATFKFSQYLLNISYVLIYTRGWDCRASETLCFQSSGAGRRAKTQ